VNTHSNIPTIRSWDRASINAFDQWLRMHDLRSFPLDSAWQQIRNNFPDPIIQTLLSIVRVYRGYTRPAERGTLKVEALSLDQLINDLRSACPAEPGSAGYSSHESALTNVIAHVGSVIPDSFKAAQTVEHGWTSFFRDSGWVDSSRSSLPGLVKAWAKTCRPAGNVNPEAGRNLQWRFEHFMATGELPGDLQAPLEVATMQDLIDRITRWGMYLSKIYNEFLTVFPHIAAKGCPIFDCHSNDKWYYQK
jgi:hypothetical protein